MDWEVETRGIAEWTGAPGMRSIRRNASGRRVPLDVFMPSVFLFSLATNPADGTSNTSTESKAGYYGGIEYRPAFRIDRVTVKSWHRLYCRRASQWCYRVVSGNNVVHFDMVQRIPRDPVDPDAWMAAPDVCRWSGFGLHSGKYRRDDSSPVGADSMLEPVLLDETRDFHFLIEAQSAPGASGDWGLVLDKQFPPILIGDRGST